MSTENNDQLKEQLQTYFFPASGPIAAIHELFQPMDSWRLGTIQALIEALEACFEAAQRDDVGELDWCDNAGFTVPIPYSPYFDFPKMPVGEKEKKSVEDVKDLVNGAPRFPLEGIKLQQGSADVAALMWQNDREYLLVPGTLVEKLERLTTQELRNLVEEIGVCADVYLTKNEMFINRGSLYDAKIEMSLNFYLCPPVVDEDLKTAYIPVRMTLYKISGKGDHITEHNFSQWLGIFYREYLDRLIKIEKGKLFSEEEISLVQPDLISNEKYSFSKKGAGWVVSFNGEVTTCKHNVGMDYISILLKRPRKEFDSMYLSRRATGISIPPELKVSRGEEAELVESDDSAIKYNNSELGDRKNLREALLEKNRLVQELRSMKDSDSRSEIEVKLGEIRSVLRMFDLRGRAREKGSNEEKARNAVGKAITKSFKKIREQNVSLYEHLTRSIEPYANRLVYNPNPLVAWE